MSTVIIQINGKMVPNAFIEICEPQPTIDTLIGLAKSNPEVSRVISGRTVSKGAYVPGKLLNLIINGEIK